MYSMQSVYRDMSFDAIVKTSEEETEDDISKYKDVWVYIEQREGK